MMYASQWVPIMTRASIGGTVVDGILKKLNG